VNRASFHKRIRHTREILGRNNPVSFQVLGICSALAVTAELETAAVMILALGFVLCSSNLVISLLRRRIPHHVRIIVFLVVISSLVVVADQVIQAFFPRISRELSVFVGLIVTNCIVMGRAEAFALKNPPLDALLDGAANTAGYGLFLLLVAFPRELLGRGTLFGAPVIPDAFYEAGYRNVGLMLHAPTAFILLGLWIWVQKARLGNKESS
jgi:Na+-transporting NADH:ubiquinone oxidoreductase subunit D